MNKFLALSGATFLAMMMAPATVTAHGCNCGDHSHHHGRSSGYGGGSYSKPRRSGGRWVAINHRDTMHCFARGSVPTGATRIRTCGGVKYKVVGGSLSTGQHRRAWRWVSY